MNTTRESFLFKRAPLHNVAVLYGPLRSGEYLVMYELS